jgi:hypothetical protein
MYALMQWRGACASRLFVFRLKRFAIGAQRAAIIVFEDLRLLTSVYVAQFIVWRALRRGGEKRIV